MRPPTGPDSVGLQPSVLPSAITMDAEDERRCVCWITAPTCRYGRAVYRGELRFALGSSTLEVVSEEAVAGGSTVACKLDIVYPLDRVDLVLVSVSIAPAALSKVTRDELVDALQHPLRDVREAVLLALGQ